MLQSKQRLCNLCWTFGNGLCCNTLYHVGQTTDQIILLITLSYFIQFRWVLAHTYFNKFHKFPTIRMFHILYSPWGPGHPLFPLSIYFLIFCCFFTFPFLSLALPILFFCPSFVLVPFYQNSPTPFASQRS